LIVVISLSLTTLPSLAQEAPPSSPSQTIVEVRVQGNRRMTDEAVLAPVKTRVGQQYSQQIALADQKSLFKTGKYDNVAIVKAETTKGVIVTFTVTERELVSAVFFRGNKHFKTKRLEKEASLAANDPLDPSRIENDRLAVENKYKSAGFYFAAVTVNSDALQLNNQVIYEIVEGPRVRVKKVRFVFEGDRSFGNHKLGKQVKTTSGLWVLYRGRLDQRQLDVDVVNLVSFYRDEGFLDAQVSRELVFSEDKSTIEVRFLINEGPHYRVAVVQFEGNTTFSDEELLRRVKMTQGEHFNALALYRDVKALRDTYGELGYLDADVQPQRLFVDPESPPPAWLAPDERERPALVILNYNVTESNQFRVGRITIRGNNITKDRVVRRQIPLYPGQLYNSVTARESQQRLMESRLFEKVTINPYGDAPDLRNAIVTVEEGHTAKFIVGAGYSTDSGLLGNFSFTQENFSWTDWPQSWGELLRGQAFKGEGQTLRINLEPGTEIMRARIDWREPYLFDRPISLGTGLYVFSRGRETYDESRAGAQVSLGKLFKNRWYGELATQLEDVGIDSLNDDAPPEVIADQGDHLLISLKGTLVRDRTDSRWRPTEGDRLVFHAEQVVGNYTFTKLGTNYRRYYTLYLDPLDRKHVLAVKASIDGVATGDAPVFDRYYGGGIGDLRGFDFRGISPRSKGTDQPIGGKMMAVLGGEYIFPITADTLCGVLFLDTGTVEEDFMVTTWRASVGFGIRLYIPYFGPIPMSLDFGFPINKDVQDETQLFSFTFGWMF